MRAWNVIVLAGILFWLAACGANTSPPTLAAETPVFVTPPATTRALATVTREPLPTRQAVAVNTQPLVVTLWVPEEFATGAERGGDILERQIAEFQLAHPNIKLEYVLKAPYGKGGMVDWLRQLSELMPERLPDAVILDSRELDQLESLGLSHSLNPHLPSGAFWDLFPPAQTIARKHGQWNNQPLTLETEHLIYDVRRVNPPPLTWQDVLTDTAQFAFAAESAESFLFHYLENGGSLAPRAQSPLDVSIMQAILEYYQQLRANGNLNENTAVMKSAREVMPLFLAGQTPMAQIRARDYLLERQRLQNVSIAPIPTRDGRAAALVSAWTFVILAQDEAKQNAAAQYLVWMIEPARLSEWANAARMLPASKSAFAQTMDDSEYAEVMWNLLHAGLVAPTFAEQAAYVDGWRQAIASVLSGQLAPDDAAFRALQTITQ